MISPTAPNDHAAFAGLDLLSTAVILLDDRLLIRHVNPAAENLFAISQRQLLGHSVTELLGKPAELTEAFTNALQNRWSYTGYNIAMIRSADETLHLDCTVTPVDANDSRLLLEFRPIDQLLKAAREERLLEQQQVSRELIRNLAHEIKNPLGGIRGSAQLLEHELQTLANAPELREYTQVIINESDRLMQPAPVNVHEILERVRRLILAEFAGVNVRRDYDTSLPEITGDREQLIQAILNIARNAAEAMQGAGKGDEIVFRTRAVRQATLVKRRYRLALEIQIIDNGPGIPEAIRERIFYPLVTGRSDGSGSGLGLTLAQSFIHQHHGTIEVESRPGHTSFTLLLPLNTSNMHQGEIK